MILPRRGAVKNLPKLLAGKNYNMMAMMILGRSEVARLGFSASLARAACSAAFTLVALPKVF